MKKILIIRFSSIGDIVLTTPVVRCIKNQFPDCEVHYLTKKQFSTILEANPNITRLYTIEKDITEVIDKLKQENYDFVIDLHKNLRSAGVIFRLRKPTSSFPKLNLKKWLLTNFRIDLMPGMHIVDRYFKSTEKLNVINDLQGLNYYIPDDEVVDMDDLPAEFSKSYIAWAIGGAHYTKIFPVDKIIGVIEKIDHPVIILGGSQDKERGEKIVSATKKPVINVCGNYSVNQSASIIKQSKLLITNDTGMMHIGAAFNNKIISIWGNTVPSFGMYPYMPQNINNSKIIEIAGLSCRPCSKIGYSKCPKKHFRCMEDIEEDRLVDAITGFLQT